MIRKVRQGQRVFSEGDRSKDVYFIQAGRVRIERVRDHQLLELATLGKGAIFGEMAMIDGRPRSATAVALEEAQLLVINQDEFEKRVANVPPWYMSILKILSKKMRLVNEQLRSSNRYQTMAGVSSFLALLAKHHQAKTPAEGAVSLEPMAVRREITELLGLNPMAVEEAMDYLVQHEMVRLDAKAMVIENVERLFSFATYLRAKSEPSQPDSVDAKFGRHLQELKTLLDAATEAASSATYSYENLCVEMKRRLPTTDSYLQDFVDELVERHLADTVDAQGRAVEAAKPKNTVHIKFSRAAVSDLFYAEQFRQRGL